MILSSIDIGSNAIRQIIVEIKPDGAWKILKKNRECIRLGTDVFNDGLIQPLTQKRLLLAFKKMARLNKKYKVEQNLAIATSAFRDAKNKKPILSAILKHSKIKIKVISGKKEAELIRRAVQHNLGSNPAPYLLIDIGGGSVELTHLQKNKIFYSQSFKWGMVRTLAEAKALSQKPQQILTAKLLHCKKDLPRAKFDIAVGTGGNFDALAKLKLSLLKKGPNTLITLVELENIYKKVSKTPHHQRVEKLKLKPDRIDVIEPAMFLTLYLMKKYHIKKIKIPGTGLKEGAILSLL